jgi:hypothetical protein
MDDALVGGVPSIDPWFDTGRDWAILSHDRQPVLLACSDFRFLRQSQGVLDLYAQIVDGTLELGVPE